MVTVSQSRREQMLERVVDYVIEHGIAELTLRRLAESAGTNNRMLLYYFGSREQIIVEAMRTAEIRFPRMQVMLAVIDEADRPLTDRLEGAWDILADPANLPFHRLFFQIFGLAGFEQNRFSDLLATVGTEWVDHVAGAIGAEGLDEQRSLVYAHEVVAVWRGLQMTLIGQVDAATVSATASESLGAIVARVRAEAARP
ncbi:MAG: hypothetical protein JWQ74_3636 [Marmoricola sp.]|nr:hypothetical protein [Marmoricola sp.]